MTWIGRKKIAFIPVFRPNAHPPDVIAADWNSDILRRVFFDPDTRTGADRSLRAYIHAASSGLADLDAVVMPMATIDLQDVRLDILDERLDGPGLRKQGFDAAAAVMLGGVGAATSQRGGFWARFVMAETVGAWAMELMHVLTGFADIRCQPAFIDCPNDVGDIGNFDEMAFNKGMHPSAYTKAAIHWLDASAIAQHTVHGGLPITRRRPRPAAPVRPGDGRADRVTGPLPDGRSTAHGRSVRIPQPVGARHS